MDEVIGPARIQLDRIRALCTQLGLKYLELPDVFIGVGIAIGFGESDYVIVSIIAGGNENQVMITDGVLKNIKQDRLAALSAANKFNQNNTAYPVYLHDAEAGWALLVQQTYPIEVLLALPSYFDNCVRALPRVVIEYRKVLDDEWDLGGEPWRWTPEDHHALLLRSML